MLPLRTVFVTAILASAVLAGPVLINKCSNTCTENTKFLYAPGTTYSYIYDGSVITTIDGSTRENSGLHIHATANIEVLDKCEMALQLRDVVIQESDPRDESRRVNIIGSDEFRRAMESRPLFFSFQDGKIEDVCPDNNEPVYVTNIKRGIISSFQNNMDDLKKDTNKTETDVTGSCKTSYRMTSDGWRSYTIEKSKDLLSCNDRHGFRSALQSTPFRVNSDIQSLPITKGDHICTYTMHPNGRILKTECRENHIFRPFSKGSNGAVTRATHTLQFASEMPGTSARKGNTRSSNLLFEHDIKEKVSKDIRAITHMLQEVCGSTEVHPETPRQFSNLVYKMRELDAESLRLLHTRVSNDQVCSGNHHQARKYFHDAVPMVGTPASVALISELVSRKHIKDSEAEMWMSSLAFIEKPTEEMISSLTTLIGSSQSKSALLPVTALVNTFCQANECSQNPVVHRIATALEGRLNGMCSARTNLEKENIMLTLKAIGNMGGVPSLSNILNKCSSSEHSDKEIRVAAIGAFRRMPCSADRSQMLSLFRDTNQDSEIRINAYLAVMQCPSREVLNSVTEMLNSEPVNQVGSFVWTHLTNLKETSDVHKLRIKQILQSEKLAKEFDLDKRKFSRNYEGSFFLESVNTGAKADANVIFSSDSYIPRSGNLNLTVDLFGKSVNLLEVGGRVEGMEKMVETFFGPKGYFQDNSINEKRSKRSANNLNRLHEQFQKAASDPKAAMYFRVFGNELGYYDLMKMAKGTSNVNILEALLFLSKDHNLDYSKSFMFLDTTITIPTIVGLPLKLAINGTATVNLKLSGKFDARQPRNINIAGTIKPSGAIVIESEMGIDASVIKTGLKMVSTVHSSTELDGHIKLQDSQIMDVKFNMPRAKQEFFTFSNKFFVIHRGMQREQVMTTPLIQKKYCTGKEVSEIVGVQICGEMSIPKFGTGPRFPLTGPTNIALSLSKTDTHSAYTFEGRFQTEKHRVNGKNIFNRKFKVAVNTPGSRVDRNIAVDLDLNRMEQKLSFDLISPWKKANAQASLVNLPEMKQLTGKFIIDGEEKGSINAEFKTSKSGEFTTYEPTLVINYGSQYPVTVNAKLHHDKKNKLQVDFKMENLLSQPVTLNMGIEKDANRIAKYSASANIRSQYLSTKFNGFFDKKQDGFRGRLNLDYGLSRKPAHSVVMSCKLRNKVSSGVRRIIYDAEVRATQLPDYSFSSNGNLQYSEGQSEANMEIRYGISHADDRIIKTGIVLSYGPQSDTYKVNGNFKFQFPEYIEEVQMVLSHQHSMKSISSAATATYGGKNQYSVEFSLNDQSSNLRRYVMDSSLKYPGREMRLYNELSEVRQGEFQHNMIAQWQRAKQVRSLLTFRQTSDRYLINGEVRITGMQPASVNIAFKPSLNDFELTMKSTMQNNVYSTRASLKKDGEHITFSSSLNIPQISPVGLTGSIKINPNDASLRAALNYRRQMYSVAYNHRFDYINQKLRSRGSIDVSIPDRRITADVTMNYVQDELTAMFKTKWDADRDDTKLASIEVSGKKTIEDGVTIRTWSFRPQFMEKHFTTRGTLKYQPNFIAVDYQWDCWRNSQLTVSYEGTLDYGVNSFDSTSKFAMKTNLMEGLVHGVSDLTARTNVHVKDQRIRFSSAVNVNNEKNFNTEFSLKYEGLTKIEVHGEIKTPFHGYKLIQGDVISTIGNRRLNAEVAANIDGGAYRVKLTGSFARVIEGSLTIQTPIHNFEQINLNLRHELTQNGYSGKTEAQWQSKKIVVDVGGVWNSILNMNSHLTIITPFRGYEKLHLDLQNMFSGFSYDAELQVIAFSNHFNVKVGAKREAYSPKYDITIKVQTPFEQARALHARGELDLDGERPTGKLSIQWNPDKQIVAEGAIQVTGPKNFETTFKVTTPFENFEENTFSIINRIDDLSFHCEGDFATAGKQFQARVSGSVKDGFHAAVELRTPFDYAREIVTDLTFKSSDKSIDTEISFQWKPDQKFSTQIVFKVLNPNDFETTLAVITPFKNFKEQRITLRFNFDGQSLLTEAHVAGWDKRFQIKASGSLDNGIHGNFELRTPFYPVEEIVLNFHHSGPVNDFKTNFDVQWAEGAKITAQLVSTCTGITNCDVSLSSKTPFKPVTSIFVAASCKKTNGHFESAVKVNVDEFHFQIGSSGTHDEQGIQASGSIKSSIEEITPLFVTFKGKRLPEETIGEVQITWSEDKTISSHLNIRKTRSDEQVVYLCTAQTSTPFEVMRQAKTTLQLTKSVNRVVVSADTLYNAYHMRYNGEVRFEPTNYALTSTLVTQHPLMRELKVSSNGQWSNERMMINADASLNGEKKFNVNFNAHMIDALNVDTQLQASALNYQAIVNYKVQYANRKFSLQSSVNSQGYAFSVETDFYSRHGKHVQGSVKVTTPFEGYERLYTSLKAENTDHKCEATLIINSGRSKILSIAYNHDQSKQATLHIETGLRFLNTIQASITHSSETNGIKHSNKIAVTIYDDVLSMETDFEVDNRKIEISNKINIPMTGFEDMVTRLSLVNEAEKSFTASFEGKSISRKSVAGRFAMTFPQKLAISFTSTCPYFEEASLELIHKGSFPRMESVLKGTYSMKGRQFQAETKLTFASIKSFSIEASLQGVHPDTLTTKFSYELNGKKIVIDMKVLREEAGFVLELDESQFYSSITSTNNYLEKASIRYFTKGSFPHVTVNAQVSIRSFGKERLVHTMLLMNGAKSFKVDLAAKNIIQEAVSATLAYGIEHKTSWDVQAEVKAAEKQLLNARATMNSGKLELSFNLMSGTIGWTPSGLKLTSSLPQMKEVSVDFNQRGTFPFTTLTLKGSLKRYESDITAEASFSMNGKESISGELKINNLMESPIVANFGYSQYSSSRTTTGQVKLGQTSLLDFKAEHTSTKMELVFNLLDQKLIAKIENPHDVILATFNFEEALIGIKASGNMEFTNIFDFHGSAKITTPFQGFKSQALNFKHLWDNVKCNMNFEIDSDSGKYAFTNFFTNERSLQIKTDIQGPYGMSLNFDLNHASNPRDSRINFINNVVFEFTALVVRIKVESDVKVNGLNDITANVHLTSPIKNFEFVIVEMKHKVENNNWEQTVEVHLPPRRSYKLANKFVMQHDSFYNSAEFSTPDTKYHAKLTHNGFTSRWNNNLRVERNDRDLASWNIAFNGFRDMSANLKCKQHFIDLSHKLNYLTKCLTKATASIQGSEYSMESLLNFQDNVIDVKLVAPKINSRVMIMHESGEGIKNTIKMNWNHHRVSSVITYKQQQFSIVVSSSCQYLQDASFTTTLKNGQTTRLTSELKMNTYGDYKIDLAYNLDDQVLITANVETPIRYIENPSLRIHYQRKTFSSVIKAGIYELVCDVNAADINNLSGALRIKNPYYPIDTAFKHSSRGSRYITEGTFSWQSGKSVSFKSDVGTTNGIASTFELSTPFNALRFLNCNFALSVADINNLSGVLRIKNPYYPIDVSFKHSNRESKYITEGTISWQSGKSVSFKSEVGTSNDISSTFELSTPFTALRNLKWNLALSVADINNLSGALRIENPYYPMDASFKHSTRGSRYITEGTFSWQSGKSVSFKSDVGTTNGISSTFELSTPFTALRNLKWHMALSMSDINNLSGALRMENLYYPIDASFKHSTRGSRFITEGTFSWQSGKSVSFKSDVDTTHGISSTFELNTPFNALRFFNWNVALSVADINNLSGNLRIKNPYYTIDASFKHNNRESKYITEGTFGWQSGKSVSFKSEVGIINDISSAFELNTPFTALRNLKWNVAYINKRLTFTAAVGGWKGEADIHVPHALQSNGMVKINKDFSITHQHNYRYGQWNQKAEMKYGEKKIIYDGSATLTDSKLNIFMNIKSSCPQFRDFTFKYDIKKNSGQTHVMEIKVDEKQLLTTVKIDSLAKLSLDVKAKKYNRDVLSVEFKHEKAGGCKTSFVLRSNEKYVTYESNMDGSNAYAILKSSSPYIKETSLRLTNSNSMKTVDVTFNEFNLNGKLSGRNMRNIRGQLNIKRENSELLNIQHSHTSENQKVIANFEMKFKDNAPITFQSECDHSRKFDVNMKVKLTTPFSIISRAEVAMESKIVDGARKCMMTLKYNRINFESSVTYNGEFMKSDTQLVTPDITTRLTISKNRDSVSMQLMKNNAKVAQATITFQLPQMRLTAEVMNNKLEITAYNSLPKLTCFVKFNDYELDAAVQYYSINQFTGLIEIKNIGRLNFENMNNGDIWTGKAKLTYQRMYVEVLHLFKKGEYSFDVMTSFKEMSVVGLKYTPRNDGHYVTLVYNQYRLVVNLDNFSIKKMNIVANLMHKNEHFATLNVQHRFTSSNYVTDARLQLPAGKSVQLQAKYVNGYGSKRMHLLCKYPNHNLYASVEHKTGKCGMVFKYNDNTLENNVVYGDKPLVSTIRVDIPVLNINEATVIISEQREGFQIESTLDRKPFATLKVQVRKQPLSWCKIELISNNHYMPSGFLEAANKKTRTGYEHKLTLSMGERQFSSHWTVEGTSNLEGQVQYRTNGNTIVAKLNGKRTSNSWELTCEINDGRNGNVNVKSTGTLSPFKTTLLVSSPLQSMKDLKFEINLEDPKLELSLNENSQQASLRTYRSRSKRSLRFRSTIPGLENMHFSLSNEDNEVKAEANFNEKKWEASLRRQMNGPYKFDAVVKTPMRLLKHATFSMTHDGGIKSFTNKVEIYHHIIGPIQTEVAARLGKHTIVRAKMTTPFDIIRTTNANLEFDITGENPISLSGNLGVNDNYVSITTSIDAKSLSNIKAMAQLQTPFSGLRKLEGKFTHRGELSNFMTTFDLTCNEKRYQTTISFENRNSKMILNVKTPFSGLETLHATIEKTENGAKLVASIPSANVALDVQIDSMYKNIKAMAQMQTPFSGLRKLEGKFTHRGDLSNFMTTFELTCAEKRYQTTISFENRNSKMILNVKTPFSGLETLYTTIEKTENGAKLVASIPSANVALDVQIDSMYKNIKAMAQMQTPFSGLRKLEGKFTHRGDLSNFMTTLDLTCEEKRYQTKISFENRNSKKMILNVKTPFSGLETLYTSIEKSGNGAKISASIPSASVALDVQTDPMYGSLILKREDQPDISTTIKIENGRVLKIDGTLNVNAKRFIVKSTLQTTDNTVFLAEFKSTVPSYEHIELKFSNNRLNKRIMGDASLFYSYNKKIESTWDINANNAKRMTASVNIRTPFENLRLIRVSHVHKLRDESASLKSEIKVEDKVMGVKAEITEFPKFGFSVEIQTPISGVEKMGFLGNMSSNAGETRVGLTAFLNKKQVGATLKFKGFEVKNHGIGIDLVSSSFQFNGQYDLLISRNSMTVKVQTRCNDKKFSIETTLVKSPNPIIKVWLTSPYMMLRTAGIEINFLGNANRFSLKSKYSLNNEPTEIELFFTRDETKTVNIRTKISGHAFSSPIELEIDGKRNPRNIAVNTNLKTPFEYIRNGRLSINHQGGLDNFATTATGHYNQHRLSFNTGHRRFQEGFIKVQSTHPSIDGLKLSLSKTDNGYAAQITYAPYKTISASLGGRWPSFSERSSGDVTFQLTTPFRSIRELLINTKHQHNGLSFIQNKLTITMNKEAMFETTVNIRCSDNNYVLSFNMVHPKPTTLQVVFNKGDSATNFAITYNQREIVRLTVTQKDESTYYRKKSETSIQITLPTRVMRAGTTIDSSRYQKIFTGEFVWDATKDRKVSYKVKVNDRSRSYQRSLVGDFELFTPIRTIRAEYSHTDDKKKYNTEVTMMWDAARNTERKLTVKTQYEDDGSNRNVEVSIRHPKMEKDLVIRVRTVRDSRMIFSGRTEVEYSNDPSDKLVFSGSLGNRSNNYTVNMQLSHPRSYLNVNMDSHVADSDSMMSAGVNLNYLAVRRAQENIYLRTEINKIKKNIKLQLNSPIQNINMVGSMQEKNNGFTINVNNDLGNNRKVESNLDINTSDMPSFDFSVMYDSENPSKQFHIAGKYLNNKEFTLESFKTEGSQRITEALFAVHLNTTRLLHTRVHWRPEMVNEYKALLVEKYNNILNEVANKGEEMEKQFEVEYETRRRIIARSLPDISPVADYLKEEIASFSSDYNTVTVELKRMYYRNEFFVRDITDMTNTLREKAIRIGYQVSRFIDNAHRSMQLRLAAFNRKVDAFAQDIIDIIADFVLRFRPGWQRYAYGAIRTYMVTSQSVRHRSAEALEFIQEVGDSVTNYLDDNFNFITYRIQPYVQKMINFRNEMRKRLRSQKEISVWDIIVDFTAEMTSELREHVDEAISYLSKMMGKNINDFLADLNTVVADQLRSYYNLGNVKTQRIMHVLRKLWGNMKSEERISRILDITMTEVMNFATAEFDEFARSYKVLSRSGFTVYNPKQGELQAELHLPVELPKLHQLPNLHMNELSNEISRLYNKYVPETPKSDYSFWDTYYKYKPTSDIKEWVPPFKGHATVMHGKHFKTFDGREFEFSGDCDYILSRDFRDASYSVFINYEHGQKLSLTIDSNGKQVKIFNDGKVVVGDRQTELPYAYANTTVSRTFDSIKLVNTEGLTVSCDLKHDICSVDISGWYYGRTGGLLGTYDNEPSNDFVTPSKELKTDSDSFARSWQLTGGRCSTRSYVSQRQSTKSAEACDKLFKETESPFRPCFKIVNPEFYNKICKTDSKPECDAMAFYIQECKNQGVPMKMPSKCNSCQNGESNTIQGVKSADVVILVEERTCNKAASIKFQSLLRQLEYSLGSKGLRQNRFGVVAYGGEGVHYNAHIHTAENKLFSDVRQVSRTLHSLDFENDGKQGDLTEAINYAAKYTFRAGVSKIFVVLPCGDDKVSASIENVLLDRAISMHIAIPHDFEMMTATPKTQYIFGVDKNTAYTVHDVRARELRGDKDFFKQVIVPQSQLIKSALKTEGSVFNIKKMTDGRSGYQKHFMDVFARRIAKTAIPTSCQTCSCVNGETICRPCDNVEPTVPPMANPLQTPPSFQINYEK